MRRVAHQLIDTFRLALTSVAMAWLVATSEAAWSQAAEKPSQRQEAAPEQPTDIKALQESIRKLRERVAAFSSARTGEAVDPQELERLQAESLDNLAKIAALQRAVGIDPPADIVIDAAIEEENQKLRLELAGAQEDISALDQEKALADERLTAERATAGRKVRQLEDAMEIAAGEIRRLELAALEAPPPPEHDPEDVARIERAEAALAARSDEIAKLNDQANQLQADVSACVQAKAEAEAAAARPPTIGEQALQVLRDENAALLADKDAAERQVAEVMALAQRCVAGIGGKDQRLSQALAQIEALEKALARERAARSAQSQ